jgi:hypothetical protein
MAVDERRRSELFQAAARAFGQEHAVTMFELLPPSGSDLATQQGVDLRFDEMERRFVYIDRRFEEMDRRFENVDRRFENVDRRFDEVETRAQERHEALINILTSQLGTIDAHILQARDEAVATSRRELVEAVSGQTRALVVAVVMAVLGIATLAMAFAQVF